MKKQLQFRPSFRWETEIENFVKDHAKGYTLNVPCGKSTLGDVRIDIDKKDNATHIYDIGNRIPFPSGTFDTVISDPPWKLGYYDRMKWFFECVYVAKVDGMVIYNATWIPESKAVELLQTFIRQSHPWSNVSILSMFRKTTDKYDNHRKYHSPKKKSDTENTPC